ncbi:MAG: DUF87 domain-containing protein [Burkholderiaceae bacterium]
MLALKPFRTKAAGLPDLLQFAALIDETTILLKNGALLCAFAYSGKDLESSSAYERNAVAGAVNRILGRLDSGWVTYHDAVRLETSAYLGGRSRFPDPISQAIEDEREAYFKQQGTVYENYYVVSFQWLPPVQTQQRVADLMYTTDGNVTKRTASEQHLNYFKTSVANVVDQLESFTGMRALGEEVLENEDGTTTTYHELLRYLNFSVSGHDHPIALPDRPMYLDSLIGGYDLVTGVIPRVDDNYIGVVAIDGFPTESYPGILADLDGLPMQYRWSNRFIYLDSNEAVGELTKYRRKWAQKVRGFKDQIMNEEKGPVNVDALSMTVDIDDAMSEAQGGMVAYGFYTSVVLLFAKSTEQAEDACRDVRRMINNRGFVARTESINAVEAFLGAVPGHAEYNVRRPFMSTRNLADILPLSSIWAGSPFAECPLYPVESPALMQCQAAGATPFRLNLHVNDVGHTAILGPTGAGKSTLLALIQAQFLRYPNATIFSFDKRYSAYALCQAVGGTHYDIGGEEVTHTFCPLADIHLDSEIAWANEWIGQLIEVQEVKLTPAMRGAIHEALLRLRESPTRSLTEFCASVQDTEIREALRPYTLSGQLGELLDGETDTMAFSHFNVYELEELMGMGDKTLLPVLTYLFHRIERRMQGQPVFLVLDEAWVALGHPTFRAQLREWFKELRKMNCAVVLATQSLSDLANSGIADVVIESCATKILLPNPSALEAVSKPLYEELLGLNTRQLSILAAATPKRQYYYQSVQGRRLFELALGPIALAFCGAAGREVKTRVDQLIAKEGDTWTDAWLSERAS